MMSDWIPTAERLPDPLPKRRVLVQEHHDERYTTDAYSVTTSQHIAWQEVPDLYVPPKPKRKRGVVMRGPEGEFNYVEELPGDPDPDVVLSVLEEWRRGISGLQRSLDMFNRIEESRSE